MWRWVGVPGLVPGSVFALAVLLGGCSPFEDFSRPQMPTRIGDAQPAAGVAVATRMPVQGIDVSSHDGDVDWAAVAKAGVKFAYIKTTEGGDYADPNFQQNWDGAEAAGIKRGAYHFIYWCRPADQQALFFMVNIPNDSDALPPVLDLEWNDDSPTCPQPISRTKAVPMIRTILAAMEARTGKRPIIYTDINFYRDVLSGGDFANYQFWLRSTGSEPQKLYPGRSYVYWQFTGTGRVPGILGDVDRNVFNGTDDDWSDWLVKVGAAPKPDPVVTASGPSVVTASAK